MNKVQISIIIPTHNRVAQLMRLLDSLAAQSYPMSQAEVIVVGDGCTDHTSSQMMLVSQRMPFTLRYIEHTARNPGLTRNLGASIAQGELLLFLDDDMLASSELVQTHVDAYAEDRVVIGYSRYILPENYRRNHLDARLWWEQCFADMQRPEHRFSYFDFFSGNVSMPAALFHQVNGFDAEFAGRLEDYELGLRLLKSGAHFQFRIKAQADHYDQTKLVQWLRRRRAEGSAEIMIALRHPETRSALEHAYTSEQSLSYRVIRSLAWHAILDGWPMDLGIRLADLLEIMNLRYRRMYLVHALNRYQHWRGQAEHFSSQKAFREWLGKPVAITRPVKVTIQDIVANTVSETLLLQASQQGITVVLDAMELFTVPPRPGSEPLRSIHIYDAFCSWLRNARTQRLSWFLAETLNLPGLRESSRDEQAPISVIVCTCDRPVQLERCLLALQKLDYHSFEVIVVDNSSKDGLAVQEIVGRAGFRYLHESRPGLNWARNTGWRAASHELIAFVHDDTLVDQDWLRSIARGFARADIDGVTGLVKPLALETEAQRLFELYGGMSKGTLPRHISGVELGVRDLLFTNHYGAGANMAFRRTALEKLGGFDTALDRGTPAESAGDIDIFHRALVKHMVMRYQPSAIVQHEHRRTMPGLEQKFEQIGRSFGVYLLKVWKQRSVPRLALARYAMGWFAAWAIGRVIKGYLGILNYPRSLALAELRGVLDAPRAFRATYAQDQLIRQKQPERMLKVE